MIRLVIISVESASSKCKGGTNRERVTSILGCSGKVGVDVVHSRYDGTNAWCVTKEKQSGVFQNLKQSLVQVATWNATGAYVPLMNHVTFPRSPTPRLPTRACRG